MDYSSNMTTMPHLPTMLWDYQNQLKEVDLGGGGTAYYVYDASGERVRKVIENHHIKEERLYFGGFEVYTKTNNGTIETERETLRINDGTKRIAILDTEKATSSGTGGTTSGTTTLPGSDPGADLGKTTIRYQYDNHLDSASLELDETGEIISYEEYHPFGTTSYRSGRTETEVSLKRYKYVGKERDNETGLYYYGARYYAAWLCRFVSVDPLQFDYPELTPFQYASNRPITGIDLDGLEFIDSNDALIKAGDGGIFWNSDNISMPLKNSISEKKMIRKTKYDSPEWNGQITLHTQIHH
ncbi:MAG: hypothetical protein GXO89_13535 [Chlorobi bacterium]|nr:hypothetical protein [Chlorobiota bacterium]